MLRPGAATTAFLCVTLVIVALAAVLAMPATELPSDAGVRAADETAEAIEPAPTPDPTPALPPVATLAPRPTPLPTPTPTPTTPATQPAAASAMPMFTPIPPTPEEFWLLAGAGAESNGRLRIRVIGPAAGEIRYTPGRSAAVQDGAMVFACIEGQAFDGRAGFAQVPGSWACGTDALIGGFRLTGQPIDAWSTALPAGEQVTETTTFEPDGNWRWDYLAWSSAAAGEVRTTVVIDPTDGHIRWANRSEPAGDTTYGISYEEAFPPIELP